MSFKHTLLALAAATALLPAVHAQDSSVTTVAENSNLWFVEFVGRPMADGATPAAVQAERERFRAAAQAAGVRFIERQSFGTLFNGMSIAVTESERRKLAELAGVKAFYPVENVAAPTAAERAENEANLAAAIQLSGAAAAQNQLGLTGRGIKVGIVDSGVDIDHPAFGGSGTPGTTPFPSQRVAFGWDFVGDNFRSDGTPAQGIPQPDANPDDCGGHGTHVAGIVGGNGGNVRGVAPEVTFGAYRVFGCQGSTTADIILAALERANMDGMQVINQSLGASRQWPQYPTAQASARLARKGIVMVASIGNNGPGGSAPDALWAAGAPGVGEGVIGVASFDNGQLSFNVNGTPNGFIAATGGANVPTSGSLPLTRTGTQASTLDGCPPYDAAFGGAAWAGGSNLAAGSQTGNAVLIRRGTCSFYAKALNAQRAGASAVILYNNAAGSLAPTVAAPAGLPAITIPVVMVAQAQGNALDTAIAASGTQNLTWTANYVGFPFGTGGLISGFSSFGLAADLSFKPQLGAPGGGILSSYPLEYGNGGVATLSGTSMSAPHVAGAAALVLQAVPTAALGRTSVLVGRNSPPSINMMTRLMNTAKPKAWSGNPNLGLTDAAYRQGAGMVDIMAAVQSQQFVVPSQIATGESEAGPRTTRLTLRNDADSAVTFTLGHTPGVANSPNVPAPGATSWAIGGTFGAAAGVAYSSNSVTVPARGMATVDVTITAPVAGGAFSERSLYGGYLTLTPQGQGTALVVPYAGLVGNYQTTQVLRPTTNNYPWLTSFNGSTYTNCAAAAGCAPFTLVGANNQPYVILQLGHHARTLRLEAIDAASGASRGLISQSDYVGRNATPAVGSIFSFVWDGVTSQGVQPSGSYRIRVRALKPLGVEANAADWEEWTSGVFSIARP